MTHGDKAKAKAAKSNKASAQKSSSKRGANGKAVAKASGKTGKGGKGVQGKAAVEVRTAQQSRPAEKGVTQKSVAPREEAGGATKGKDSRAASAPGGGTFSNPVIGAAFKRALKKYPNAFRKLTD